MDTLIPKVLQAVAGENFTVYLYFNDGSVRLYDAKPLLEPMEQVASRAFSATYL